VGGRSQQRRCVVRLSTSNQRAVGGGRCSSGRRRPPYTGPREMTTQALESSGKDAASSSMIQAARLPICETLSRKNFQQAEIAGCSSRVCRDERLSSSPERAKTELSRTNVGRALPAGRDGRRWGVDECRRLPPCRTHSRAHGRPATPASRSLLS
jgi:hypothetical protein